MPRIDDVLNALSLSNTVFQMGYVFGVLVALAASALGRYARFDRDQSFYATILVVTASYYVLFAAMSGSTRISAIEVLSMLPFVIAAVIGFKKNLWVIVAALLGHCVLDLFHDDIVVNQGMPLWWPSFCMSFDVVAGLMLAILITRSKSVERFAARNGALVS